MQGVLLCSWKHRRRNLALIFPSEVEEEEDQLVHCLASSLSLENCLETVGLELALA